MGNSEMEYLKNEVSELRSIVRMLSSRINELCKQDDPKMQETLESFDVQWKCLDSGKHLLSDPSFVENLDNLIGQYTGLPAEWFRDKSVLDAGCGNGRFTYGFLKLGAKVTAMDYSKSGINSVKANCAAFSGNLTVLQHNILAPVPFKRESFDLVFSFGVLHHTGDTYTAFKNLVPLVKENGYLFLMLYGEPNNESEYTEINQYTYHRRQTAHMSNAEKIEYCRNNFPAEYVHGWFDAISPSINDLYRKDEIGAWLHRENFDNIKFLMPDSRNIFVIAQK